MADHDHADAKGCTCPFPDDWERDYAIPEGVVRAFCALCDGTGSFPDADHPCSNCCGLGEVHYIPFPIRRKDA